MSEKIALIGLFDSDGHLTPSALEALRDGSMCEDGLTAALEHMGSCEKCAAAFADSFENTELAQVPAGFDEELQKKFKTKTEGNRGFAVYVIKVALAACVALIITFSSGFNALVSRQNIAGNSTAVPSFSFVNSISDRLNSFSQNILNWRF